MFCTATRLALYLKYIRNTFREMPFTLSKIVRCVNFKSSNSYSTKQCEYRYYVSAYSEIFFCICSRKPHNVPSGAILYKIIKCSCIADIWCTKMFLCGLDEYIYIQNVQQRINFPIYTLSVHHARQPSISLFILATAFVLHFAFYASKTKTLNRNLMESYNKRKHKQTEVYVTKFNIDHNISNLAFHHNQLYFLYLK